MYFFEPEEMIPVVVQGDRPALNINNFQNLGLGVQNIMLAYHGLSDDEEEAPVEDAAQDHEMMENQIADNVSDPSLEAFQFNDFASPEVVHLHIARVETHIFPEEETQKFSKEGMELWKNTLHLTFSLPLMLLDKRYWKYLLIGLTS
jgi:hypothetical protein